MGGVCCRSQQVSYGNDHHFLNMNQRNNQNNHEFEFPIVNSDQDLLCLQQEQQVLRERQSSALNSSALPTIHHSMDLDENEPRRERESSFLSSVLLNIQRGRSSRMTTTSNYISSFSFRKKSNRTRREAENGENDAFLDSSLSRGQEKQKSKENKENPPLVPCHSLHYEKTPQGIFTPLSLVNYCIRTICTQQQLVVVANGAYPIPSELAVAMIRWLKAHEALTKDVFQKLVQQTQPYEWNLSLCADVDDEWVQELLLCGHLTDHITLLDVSECRQLQRILPKACHRLHIDDDLELFKSLNTASFAGCDRLEPSALQLLYSSKQLQRLNLCNCRKMVTSRGLLMLTRRVKHLKQLDLSGCTQVTNQGLKGLEVLKELESLVLNQCTLLTSTCLDMLLNHQQVDEKTKLTSTLFPRLKTLELAQCKLKNKTLKAIGTLKQLERLVIRGCQQITDEGLESLAHLKQLRYFDARNCPQICDGPRIEWMATLEVLLLARGGFTECRAAILKDFKSLKELDLRACHKIGRNTFEIIARTCRNLERLVLAETPLDDQSLIQVCQNLSQLTSLDLGSTEITDHGTQAFFQLKKMKRLHLDVSELHNRTLVHISSLCHLEYLDLFGAGISESGLYHLIRLKKLKHLEICNGFIGNRGVKLIAKITSLTSLNLSQNRNIQTKALIHLKALKELKYLNLSNTNITALALRHFYPLKELESLSIYGCALTQTHIDLLKENLLLLKYLRCD